MEYKEQISDDFAPLEMDGGGVALTVQVNDIAELKNRQTAFTNEFKVPKTRYNEKLLGKLSEIGSNSNAKAVRYESLLETHGIPIATDLFSEVRSVGEMYAIRTYGILKNIFDRIGDKKLTELNLGRYAHEWTHANIAASQSNTEGYIYALVEYSGTLSTSSAQVNSDRLLPSFYVRTLVEQILTDAGFSINIGGDELYNKCVVPYCRQTFAPDDTQFAIDRSVRLVNDVGAYTGTAGSTTTTALTFDYVEDDVAGLVTGLNTYTADRGLQVRIGLIATWSWNVPVFGDWIALIVKKNGTEVDRITTYYDDIAPVGLIDGDIYVNLADTDAVTFEIEFDLDAGSSTQSVTDIRISVDVLSNVIFGDTINPESVLPRMKQRDFLKAVLQIFGIILVPDAETGAVDFFLHKNYSGEAGEQPQDLTQYVSGEPVQEFHATTYAQKNIFKYANADDVEENIPENLGEGSFDIEDATLDAEKVAIESAFSATAEYYQRFNGDIVSGAHIHIFDSDANHYGENPKPRICFLDQLSYPSGLTQNVFDATSPYIDTGVTAWYAAHFTNNGTYSLEWNDILTEYYPVVTQCMQDYKRVFFPMRIPSGVFRNIDFYELVQIGSHWFVPIRIKDYKENGECIFEMLKY